MLKCSMFCKKISFTNVSTASFISLCALTIFLFTQSLSLAHDLTHLDHEETDYCQLLEAFNSEAVLSLAFSPKISTLGQINFALLTPTFFEAKIILHQRSRAPPELIFS